MYLPLGKIPKQILEEVVFRNLGAHHSEVTLGPSAGIDAAVVEVGQKSIIISMDPVTGAREGVGWLAVNVNANDVATFGVPPAFLTSTIMLPQKADRNIIESISREMGKAAKALNIAIIGGHCEVTSSLKSIAITGCAIGVTEKGHYVTSAGARAGDKLLLTKSAGLEGTAILASDRKNELKGLLNPRKLGKAARFYERISVVKEAISAFKTGAVSAMHDPTEGGIAGGIHEMADASKLGATIYENRIRVEPETLEICRIFNIDPLQLISSGALLIAAKPNGAASLIDQLEKQQIQVSEIGEFTENKSRAIVCKDGGKHALPRPSSDHLWRALETNL